MNGDAPRNPPRTTGLRVLAIDDEHRIPPELWQKLRAQFAS